MAVISRVRTAGQLWTGGQAGVPVGPIVLLAALVVLFTIAEPTFFSVTSFRAIGSNAAIVLAFAVGETFVIITGRIDLSVGGMASLASVLLPTWIPTIGGFAIPVVILLFALAGVFQGWVHWVLRLPSFVVTIAGLFIADGLALVISNANQLALPYDNNPTTWLSGNRLVAGIPNSVLAILVVLIAAAATLRWLRLGRRVYAIGVSERAAILAGLPVRSTVLAVFGISGACAGLAGTMLIASYNAGNAGFADSQLLPAIAAVVIGGTAISGGAGGIARTLIGALVLSVLLLGMTVAGWPPELQQIIYGAILIIAVLITTDRRKMAVVK
jgi:ribose transport system permease protein